MEYVEGRDLKGLIQEREKFTAEEAVPIVVQIAAAFEAAHTAGVVRRDLKPQNVMSDKDGRVYVMDFGIARSLEHQGMTQTGALMGTPEYMSPEQAKGEKVDARSDLFALGIIFYEMLTSISPFKADTAMAMMFKRTQERATPLSQLNIGVPPVISDIVSKCLEIKTEERYQTAREIINDLEAWKGGWHTVQSCRTEHNCAGIVLPRSQGCQGQSRPSSTTGDLMANLRPAFSIVVRDPQQHYSVSASCVQIA
jgi:eukaryotic-like serine/threonine-protein kinase